jgi:hypothetical protein
MLLFVRAIDKSFLSTDSGKLYSNNKLQAFFKHVYMTYRVIDNL